MCIRMCMFVYIHKRVYMIKLVHACMYDGSYVLVRKYVRMYVHVYTCMYCE